MMKPSERYNRKLFDDDRPLAFQGRHLGII